MKITDINVYCLERIMRYLDLNDLLNVADSNKCLRSVAESVFSLKYKNEDFCICSLHLGSSIPSKIIQYRGHKITRYSEKSYSTRVRHSEKIIVIHTLKVSLQLLRCFGHLIKKLELNDEGVWRKDSSDHIWAYISEHCAETLCDLAIKPFRKQYSNSSKKRLLNVEELLIGRSILFEQDPQQNWMNELFPKLRYLEIVNQFSKPYLSCIENRFLNLKHLKLVIQGRKEYGAHWRQVLCLNPQLESLDIPFTDDSELYRCISENLPHLQHLSLNMYYRGDRSRYYNGPMYHLGNVRSFDFNLSYSWRIPMPFLFGSNLEELTLNHCNLPLKSQLLELATKHPSLQKFTMSTQGWNSLDEVIEFTSKIVRAFPSLRVFSLGCIDWEYQPRNNIITKESIAAIMKRCGPFKRYEIVESFNNGDQDYLSYCQFYTQ